MWDVFRRAPSRGGRGRGAAVDFVGCFGWDVFFFCDFFFFIERTRPAACTRPPRRIYLSSTSTDCEICTRTISTNPGSMEAGEYGLTRGTCFVARRLEAVAVAGFLWISWCVLGAAGFRVIFLFLFFERTRPAGSMRPPCPINLSTSSCTINFQPSGRAFFYRGSLHIFSLFSRKMLENDLGQVRTADFS